MQMKRLLATLAAAGLMASGSAQAQDYPCDGVEWIVGWGAGGGSDVFARSIAPAVSEELGVPVTVLNMPGASSITAMQEVLNRPSDACTIFSITPDQLTNELTGLTEESYETLTPVMRAHVDLGMIHGQAGSEFDTWEKLNSASRPVLVGGTGAASFDEIVVEIVMGETGVEYRYIPYEDASAMHADLLGGRLDAIYEEVSVVGSMIEANQVEPLLVLGESRLDQYPDVPAAGELDLPVPPALWRGVAVKAGTDEAAVAMLEEAFLKAAESEAYQSFEQERMLDLTEGRMGADDFAELLAREHDMYSRVIGEQ